MNVTMEAEQNAAEINGGDKSDDKPKCHDPLVTPGSVTGRTGSLAEVTSFSEQLSTEDTELSSADISVNKTPEAPVEADSHNNPERGLTRAASVEKNQPKPPHAPSSSPVETCTVHEASRSFASISRSLKTTTTTTQTVSSDEEDLCAAVLLGCLFCHPLDCLLAAARGFNMCALSLCSSLCGCDPATLRPLLDFTHHRCDPCGCLGARCFLCDCPVCDICLQATECLDLAMEISQMLYH